MSRVAVIGTPCQSGTRTTGGQVTAKPTAAARHPRRESVPARAKPCVPARTPAIEKVITKQYACAAGSFKCTRINAKGNRRAAPPVAYFAVRQNQPGGDWNKIASATAKIAKIPMLILIRVKAAASEPAAAMAGQRYRGFDARIPLPARKIATISRAVATGRRMNGREGFTCLRRL